MVGCLVGRTPESQTYSCTRTMLKITEDEEEISEETKEINVKEEDRQPREIRNLQWDLNTGDDPDEELGRTRSETSEINEAGSDHYREDT